MTVYYKSLFQTAGKESLMSDNKAVMGIDIGTGSLKAIVLGFDDAAPLAEFQTNYEYDEAKYEQGVVPVRVYIDAVKQVLNEALGKFDLVSIALSSQMYSICADVNDELVAFQWNTVWDEDEEASEILDDMYDISGCPVKTLYPSYKMISKTGRHIDFKTFGFKEYVVSWLTGGEMVVDLASASATGLFDIHNNDWNRKMLDIVGFRYEDMPKAERPDHVAGYITNPEIDTRGLKIAVCPGIGDGPSASYACKKISNIACNVGTSTAVRALTHDEGSMPLRKLWRYSMDDGYHAVGNISAFGCAVIDRARDLGMLEDVTEDSGSHILFYPERLKGKAFETLDDYKACMVGLEPDSTMEEMGAAVIKGIGFIICQMAEQVNPEPKDTDLMIVVGGGLKIPLLREIMLNTLSIRVGTLEDSVYLVSLGAAASALEGAGSDAVYDPEGLMVYEPTGRFSEEFSIWKENR